MKAGVISSPDRLAARLNRAPRAAADVPKKILTVFGTRPEAIKLAPVIRSFESDPTGFQTVNVSSSQHTNLLRPFTRTLGIRLDYDLSVMQPGQTLNAVCSRVLCALDPIFERERPDMVFVQGDTTTAFAGALAAFHRGLRIAHVEAGLRSHDPHSPFPEEMNRRMISSLATFHFAATPRNRATLISEGVDWRNIFVTGNTVVDSLHAILERKRVSPRVRAVLDATRGMRRLILTTHRRESFGAKMIENLKTLRRFVAAREDVALIFPVHPNPEVTRAARGILARNNRVHLIEPLDYKDFITLLSRAWLIVSDSGGVQEEAPTLGKPLLILRENTERPEAIDAGVARLVGAGARALSSMLDEAYAPGSWAEAVGQIENPFGRGESANQIVEITRTLLRAAPAAGLLRQVS